MPGYGYSDRPTGPPLDSISVAGLWAELMDVLGYVRFGAAGGDIGSAVSRYLALDYPDRVMAVHRMDAGLPVFTGDPAGLTAEEGAWLKEAAAWGATEGAYAAMHRTKPQTAAVGLTDSPAGLAAWIVEKLRAWSDCAGQLERRFTKDEVLTNVTLYWLTGTIGSSMRMYHANAAISSAQHARRVEVPSGFSPSRATFPTTVCWLERMANVVRVTEPADGGHFAPFEEPELYAEELRVFFVLIGWRDRAAIGFIDVGPVPSQHQAVVRRAPLLGRSGPEHVEVETSPGRGPRFVTPHCPSRA